MKRQAIKAQRFWPLRRICLIFFPVVISYGAMLGQTPSNLSVELAIPVEPMPVQAKGQIHLAYELHITNFRQHDLTLKRIDVFAQGIDTTPLASYYDKGLIDCLDRIGPTSEQKDNRVIGGGRRAVAYLWISVAATTTIPIGLHHRLFFAEADSNGKIEESMMYGPRVIVRKERPIVISPPLRGPNWVAVNGPSNSANHRRALNIVDGRARIAQRFAYDWMKLGEDGKFWRGDSSKNENWYGYGAEALAVADGIVSDSKDGIPENTPRSPTHAVPITLETIGGNYIILDLGKGRFAWYAHLQPKSLRVKTGDRVRRGQVLGLLGNAGQSSAPHLHFHISDANSPLGAEGLPFVLESFEEIGEAKIKEVLELGWKPLSDIPFSKRQREMPLGNMVIRFH